MIRYTVRGFEPRYHEVLESGAVIDQDKDGEWCEWEDVEQLIEKVFKMIENIEELEGEIPNTIFNIAKQNKEKMAECFRTAVRITKDEIKEKLIKIVESEK